MNIWKMGLEFVKQIYRISSEFPKEEQYGLTSQLRRSSTSILANFSEGCGRFTYKDKAAKFVIARGECAESQTFLLIAKELGFGNRQATEKALADARSIARMLSSLINSCRAKNTDKKPNY